MLFPNANLSECLKPHDNHPILLVTPVLSHSSTSVFTVRFDHPKYLRHSANTQNDKQNLRYPHRIHVRPFHSCTHSRQHATPSFRGRPRIQRRSHNSKSQQKEVHTGRYIEKQASNFAKYLIMRQTLHSERGTDGA